MDTLPFQYGAMYKPTVEYMSKYSVNFITQYDQKTYISNTNSSGTTHMYMYPTSGINSINWNYYFLPNGFIEKSQKVIGTVFFEESKQFSMLIPSTSGYGISFNQDRITEKATKPFRVELDVHEFIKNFEKVL